MGNPFPLPPGWRGVATGGKVMLQRLRGQRAFSRAYCSFAYSALACFRMGMSGPAQNGDNNLFAIVVCGDYLVGFSGFSATEYSPSIFASPPFSFSVAV